MTEELVIREIRIDEAADRGDPDSLMTSFKVIMPLKTPINYESPIVRCVALSRLEIRENECFDKGKWRVRVKCLREAEKEISSQQQKQQQ